VAAVCADFHGPVVLPKGILPHEDRWLGFFPGSTLGNMLPETAVKFLKRASETLGPDAEFLIGIDLEKDKRVLEAAYNDREGITAAFNLNLLTRMRRELGAELEIDAFEHYAFYNEQKRRIEMHLRAVRPTAIRIGEGVYNFEKGETLHTENSHKYSLDRLEALFAETPWRLKKHWIDEKQWFAACLLSNS